MNPDVAAAVAEMERNGLLPAEVADRAGREARGELVPIRTEVRVLYGVGGALVATGVGLLLKENLERIGPVAIAAGLALATAGVFFFVHRKAAPFSCGESESKTLAFPALLLLGAALLAATIGWTEWKLTPLGAGWRHHLLLMSAIYAALAVRYDSRPVLTLALSTFAAWRGFSVTPEAVLTHLLGGTGSKVANGLICAAVFAAASAAFRYSGIKKHFERTTTFAAALALLFGVGTALDGATTAAGLALVPLGGGVLAFGLKARRFELFAIGLVAAYVGLSAAIVTNLREETFGCFWFSSTSLGVLVLLILMAKKLREPEAGE